MLGTAGSWSELYKVGNIARFRVMGKPTNVVAKLAPNYSVAPGGSTLALTIDGAKT